MPKPRLAIVITHPIQYYTPLYQRIAERGMIELRVFYLSDVGARKHFDRDFGREVAWDIPLLDGYSYKVLQPGLLITALGFWERYDAQLIPMLEEFSPDWLLVHGYASRMNWSAWKWSRKQGVKILYTSDSNIRDPKSFIFKPFKEILLRYFFRGIDTFFSPSEANTEYLIKFGVERESIKRLPFAISVQRFQKNALLPGRERPYDFIWAGKFVAIKRLQDFLMALPIVANAAKRPVKACVVGDGPLRSTIKRMANRLPPQCCVDFFGFINQNDMPGVLQKAHTLVFTSEREAYGIVATEAAAAGLALIVADNIGCVGQTVLARPDVNALTFRAGDVAGLAQVMHYLLVNPLKLECMQVASKRVANEHDIDNAVSVIEKVVTR